MPREANSLPDLSNTLDSIAVCDVHGWYWPSAGYGAERCPEPGCGARVDSYVYARSYTPPASDEKLVASDDGEA